MKPGAFLFSRGGHIYILVGLESACVVCGMLFSLQEEDASSCTGQTDGYPIGTGLSNSKRGVWIWFLLGCTIWVHPPWPPLIFVVNLHLAHEIREGRIDTAIVLEEILGTARAICTQESLGREADPKARNRIRGSSSCGS